MMSVLCAVNRHRRRVEVGEKKALSSLSTVAAAAVPAACRVLGCWLDGKQAGLNVLLQLLQELMMKGMYNVANR